jgi:SAM-dependent methyltransferase
LSSITSAREHYQRVLAPHYSRMFGDFDAKVAEQQAVLERLRITPWRAGALAVDLGCGSGFQSIALARLGFRVLAVDFTADLLSELETRATALAVDTFLGDIRDAATLLPDDVDVTVCMGDTLSHLDRHADVTALFQGVASRFRRGGRLVLGFRDLSVELHGLDRAVPVRASDDLVASCFLEYGPDVVTVHDLLWVRDAQGWTFRKGAYRKLRLSASDVATRLEHAGFKVERTDGSPGMVLLVGTRV